MLRTLISLHPHYSFLCGVNDVQGHLVFAGALFVSLAIALNATVEPHRDRIKEAIAKPSTAAAVLRLGSLKAFVSNYHTLGVATYTTINDKIKSFGLLGMAFVSDSNQ